VSVLNYLAHHDPTASAATSHANGGVASPTDLSLLSSESPSPTNSRSSTGAPPAHATALFPPDGKHVVEGGPDDAPAAEGGVGSGSAGSGSVGGGGSPDFFSSSMGSTSNALSPTSGTAGFEWPQNFRGASPVDSSSTTSGAHGRGQGHGRQAPPPTPVVGSSYQQAFAALPPFMSPITTPAQTRTNSATSSPKPSQPDSPSLSSFHLGTIGVSSRQPPSRKLSEGAISEEGLDDFDDDPLRLHPPPQTIFTVAAAFAGAPPAVTGMALAPTAAAAVAVVAVDLPSPVRGASGPVTLATRGNEPDGEEEEAALITAAIGGVRSRPITNLRGSPR